jgi:hypothetical protein
MKYRDAQGRVWGSAEEALTDFVSDLPAMTDEETENLFSATRHDADAATNLDAIRFAATYHGLAGDVLGYYPIPEPSPGWYWWESGDKSVAYMMADDAQADHDEVPLFQRFRLEMNRRILKNLHTTDPGARFTANFQQIHPEAFSDLRDWVS